MEEVEVKPKVEPDIPQPPPSANGGMQFKIAGKVVDAPVKLYSVQHAAMNRIVNALEQSEHALIESPTGTGKTISLLCSVLAWQTDKRLKFEAGQKEAWAVYMEAVEQLGPDCSIHVDSTFEDSVVNIDVSSSENTPSKVGSPAKPNTPVKTSPLKYGNLCFADDDDDFKSPQKFTKLTPKAAAVSTPLKQVQNIEESALSKAQAERDRKIRELRVPKVYYATRTQRQAAQACAELKRTVYSRLPMATLSSREHTCIHPEVSRSRNKNNECEKLLDPHDGRGCLYKTNQPHRLASFEVLEKAGLGNGWDIEDLVKVGRQHKACPYFATRDYAKVASIVFCPYNYILDPRIRESTQIVLDGDIVILDEAHNVEDACREAVSGSIAKDMFDSAMKQCKDLGDFYKHNRDVFSDVSEVCNVASTFIANYSSGIEMSPDSSKNSVNVATKALLDFLKSRALSLDTLTQVKQKMQRWVANSRETENKKSFPLRLSSNTVHTLEEFVDLMALVYTHENDYRINVEKELRKGQNGISVIIESLNVWCLNPEVCFQPLAASARSIILASGTLSPLESFQSELGVQFKYIYEAGHVIPRPQMWVGSVGYGPSGTPLKATYEHTSQFAFQDDLGRLVLDVSKLIPHGVLLFIPSYFLMKKLLERWEQTGLLSEIECHKGVFSEPNSSDQMANVMSEFYECLEGDTERNGAVLVAVYRGKASEGMDFADEKARAVICVGIPYPNFADPLVKLKREYNDRESKLPGSTKLNGSKWYEIQAFRALNQAIGRCLRHRNDWGAILLVDQRWNDRYSKSLSKWVREALVSHNSYGQMQASLSYFAKVRTGCEEQA